MLLTTSLISCWLRVLQDEEHRIEEGEAETRKNMKAAREHHKSWESSRDKRVNTWRDFAGQKGGKKQVRFTIVCSEAKRIFGL